jgi:hypothetical protein
MRWPREPRGRHTGETEGAGDGMRRQPHRPPRSEHSVSGQPARSHAERVPGHSVEPPLKLPTLPPTPRLPTPLGGAPSRPEGWGGTVGPQGHDGRQKVLRSARENDGPFVNSGKARGAGPDITTRPLAPAHPMYPQARLRVPAAQQRSQRPPWPIEQVRIRGRQLTRPVERLSSSRVVMVLSGGNRGLRLLLTALIVVVFLAGASTSALGITRLAVNHTALFGQQAGTTSFGTQRSGKGALPVERSGATIQENAGTFVRSTGTQLRYGTQPLRLYGSTFYPALVGGPSAWHQSSFTHYIDQVVAMGQLAGQDLLRPTDFWDTTNTHQVWNDPTVWANMDYLVQTTQRHGMFVILDLSAYKWLLESEGQDPYNAANWTAYLDFVGARFANSPSIAFYSIVGEPPAPTTPMETANLVGFYRAVTDELYRADGGHHLIAAGGFNHMEDAPSMHWWQQIYSLPHNDVCAFKTYSQHDLNLMPTITAYAYQLGKPLVDEEFGMPQYLGDGSATGQSYNGISTSRAQFYANVYTEGEQHGVIGFVFWNLGCQIGSTSYEVSPLTPAVWQVVAAHGPATAVPWPGSGSPCS